LHGAKLRKSNSVNWLSEGNYLLIMSKQFRHCFPIRLVNAFCGTHRLFLLGVKRTRESYATCEMVLLIYSMLLAYLNQLTAFLSLLTRIISNFTPC
jgi:hypothetical protein